MSSGHRPAALLALALGGTVFVAVAAVLIPWGAAPDLAPAPVSSVLGADEVERAEAFSTVARRWGWGSLAVSLAVVCWLGFTRHGVALVRRLPGPWWVQVLLAVAAVRLIGRLLTLPLAVGSWRHRRDYGLSTQSWGGFASDVAKSEALDVLVTSLVLLVLVGTVRRWRRWWPLVAGGLAAAAVVVGSFGYPVLVEPVFNRFTPLAEGQLRSEVLALADREDVRVEEVLVADASRRTTTLNAYVSGFGGTRRVVLYDNLVDDVPQDVALSIVAHELAHARYDDVLVGTVLGAAGVLAAVGALGLLVGSGSRRRVDLGDPVAVPRVLALLAIGSLLAAPLQNGISRTVELRADVVALEVTEDPGAFEELQRTLARRSLHDPTPPAWSQWAFGSHPTTLQRVALARWYAGR